jgi:hypothetical protein
LGGLFTIGIAEGNWADAEPTCSCLPADPPYTKKMAELAEMLDRLVAADKLELVDKNYTIKPS